MLTSSPQGRISTSKLAFCLIIPFLPYLLVEGRDMLLDRFMLLSRWLLGLYVPSTCLHISLGIDILEIWTGFNLYKKSLVHSINFLTLPEELLLLTLITLPLGVQVLGIGIGVDFFGWRGSPTRRRCQRSGMITVVLFGRLGGVKFESDRMVGWFFFLHMAAR